MKIIYLITCFFFFAIVPIAQDTIIKTNLDFYVGKIQSKNENQLVLKHFLNNDTILQVFPINELIQIIYSNGEVEFFEHLILTNIVKTTETIRNYFNKSLRELKNYAFTLNDGKVINATLLKKELKSYKISEKNGEISFIPRFLIKNVTQISDTINQYEILPYNREYYYNHTIYSKREIFRLLLESNYQDVEAITKKAKNKSIQNKFFTFSIIVTGSFSMLSLYYGMLLNTSSLNPNYNPFWLSIASGLFTLPFPILVKKTKVIADELLIKSINLFNSKN